MEWVFDGGRPCLDLVNTVRERHEDGRELLTDAAALAEWLPLMGFAVTEATVGELSAARALREAVDKVLLGAPRPTDVLLLNEMAADAPSPWLRIDKDGKPVKELRPVSVIAALGDLAADAIDLATEDIAVRICAADDCGLRFCDASPRRSRQWCSMARCGNRAKARAHYARTKSQAVRA
ncbi:CGNR zinc finger domain-containing protein [Amycolatopsis sp. NPDC051071]|uniref:CGNR zinc finger domain-containing protein n=1 Tax=Amycolatopsis sp. NPDC051071 TaxID=3154637 RepID=UPI0034484C70